MIEIIRVAERAVSDVCQWKPIVSNGLYDFASRLNAHYCKALFSKKSYFGSADNDSDELSTTMKYYLMTTLTGKKFP